MEDGRTSTRQAWRKCWAEGRRKGRGAGVVGEMTAGGRRGWSGGAGEINGGREDMVGVEGTGTAMGRVSAVAAPSRRLRGVALAIACRHFRALMGVSSRLTQNSLIGAHAPLPASHPIEIPPLSVLRHIAPAPRAPCPDASSHWQPSLSSPPVFASECVIHPALLAKRHQSMSSPHNPSLPRDTARPAKPRSLQASTDLALVPRWWHPPVRNARYSIFRLNPLPSAASSPLTLPFLTGLRTDRRELIALPRAS